MYLRFFKPIFDKVASFLLLILISPIFFTILLWLAFEHKGEPFFFQVRTGLHQKSFTLLKFRSMKNKKSNKNYITKFGAWMRQYSIDEWPQLLNVLKGDMSLIGPRPLLPHFLPYYSPQQQKRHLVKPGMTGWAQVNGRNDLTWTAKFAYDVAYVEKASFTFDLLILWKTLFILFKKEGVNPYKKGIEDFDGTN